ncbi:MULTISPECIES: hypothetical protein [unclassified Tolypothrix]|uniref:hypothetical protein n=1 Tax=unclassified Tolypothrix TaxID=2649714 RepID=UPI0005EAC3EC|nr:MULTISPECIES: hypothetical protein [unclassified Tolypothrix]EKF05599.1 hypothetical protein FDUTEX481_00454 [Tolypothrix sp. PCC 7601]MBE9085435.1 hypothetical protein [Tolypothrix sp. LEGE 11397]UYD26489.1 hypothetical protein HGR01_35295 [Tolypothrix sp. PCC 7712]UYD31272.1 hypothetical protein HG267_19185 [Tolypothrix sp. PCC 7601]
MAIITKFGHGAWGIGHDLFFPVPYSQIFAEVYGKKCHKTCEDTIFYEKKADKAVKIRLKLINARLFTRKKADKAVKIRPKLINARLFTRKKQTKM